MSIPSNPIGIYWESYYGAQTRIINLPQQYNVIFLFQAIPTTPTGAIAFQRGATTATLNADIATCRARGQRVIMTCGGSGAQITINSQATADAFIASVKSTNVSFGGSGTAAAFDGIDFNNFEGAASGQATPQWMTYAAQQLKNFYGTNFLITAPPAVHGQFAGGQAVSDRLLLATMYKEVDSVGNHCLDWFCPQNYDGPGNDNTDAVRTAREFYHTPIFVGGTSVQLPYSVIGVGFAISTLANYWTTAEAISCYNLMVSEGRQPKGAFNFSANNNPSNSFATDVAPVITNNTGSAPDPAFALAASSQFTNGAVTTARLLAPSGKTTGNFQAGSINETSNPAAAIDLTTDKYSELEWNLVANSTAVNAQAYEWRITNNGVSLDTYSVIPTLTIGTPAEDPPPPSSGALVASKSAVDSPTTVTTGAINTTSATLLVIGIAVDAGSTPAVSDSKSNTWIPLTSSSLTVKTQLYYAVNPSVGTGHTFTCAGADTYPAIAVGAFSGVRVASPFDVENGATVTGSATLSNGSITPTENGELIVSVLGFNVAGLPTSIGSSFIETDDEEFGSGNNYGITMAYLSQATAAAVNPVWTRTGTGSMSARIASFKAGTSASCVGIGSLTSVSSITFS